MSEEKQEKFKINLPGGNSTEVEKGLVIVGANGCGKTRLGKWFARGGVGTRTHRISAQKVLLFPRSVRFAGVEQASRDFINDRNRIMQSTTEQVNDYDKLLAFLFSERSEVCAQYVDKSKVAQDRNQLDLPDSKLDRIKRIWEDILPHRQLVIEKGEVNVRPNEEGSSSYSAVEMSDGERVIFYFIGQCLSAPEKGMIIVDEPETHLHKAIQSILWNKIERERNDCVFVYLTHDVAFAASRVGFKKIWLQNYLGGNDWQLRSIAESQELPEELLLELYGSRRKILLIEGVVGSNESKIYQNLFEGFLVKPCGSCENVISYVTSLKNNREFHHENVYGLIDRDRRTSDEIASLRSKNIFCLEVAEFENLFVTPEVLNIVSEKLAFDPKEKLNQVEEKVFDFFGTELETQIQEHLRDEIKWQLSRLNLSELKDGSLSNLIEREIDLDSVKERLRSQFNCFLENREYVDLLKKYNRKTIASRIASIYGLMKGELIDLVVRLSNEKEFQPKLKSAMSNYLPKEFNEILNNKKIVDEPVRDCQTSL